MSEQWCTCIGIHNLRAGGGWTRRADGAWVHPVCGKVSKLVYKATTKGI